MCFFAGGTRFSEQGFGQSTCPRCSCLLSPTEIDVFGWLVVGAVQLNSSLLTLSVIAVLLPAAFHNAVTSTGGTDPLTNAQEGHDILSISHGVRSPPFHVRS